MTSVIEITNLASLGSPYHSVLPLWLSALPGGGDDGNRTHDPLLAGQVLSQLSYTPVSTGLFFFNDRNNRQVVSDP